MRVEMFVIEVVRTQTRIERIINLMTMRPLLHHWLTPFNLAYLISTDYYHFTIFTGSSTACVVLLNREDSTLYTANIGDSGFMVVRKGRVVRRSEEQQHYFNTPFQVLLLCVKIFDFQPCAAFAKISAQYSLCLFKKNSFQCVTCSKYVVENWKLKNHVKVSSCPK